MTDHDWPTCSDGVSLLRLRIQLPTVWNLMLLPLGSLQQCQAPPIPSDEEAPSPSDLMDMGGLCHGHHVSILEPAATATRDEGWSLPRCTKMQQDRAKCTKKTKPATIDYNRRVPVNRWLAASDSAVGSSATVTSTRRGFQSCPVSKMSPMSLPSPAHCCTNLDASLSLELTLFRSKERCAKRLKQDWNIGTSWKCPGESGTLKLLKI